MNTQPTKHSKSNAQRSTSKRGVAAYCPALGVEWLRLSAERFRPGAEPVLSSTRGAGRSESHRGPPPPCWPPNRPTAERPCR